MSLLLNIDTALSTASVCLSDDDRSIAFTVNKDQQGHAAWLHQAIDEMIKKTGYSINQLDAVSVSIGPGSYTGLRVGLSSAKGFCFAAKIPLITITTTEMLAFAVKNEAKDLICPAIDARRMEIFTAIYDKELREIKSPYSLIAEKNSFDEYLANHALLFCGDGCRKLQDLLSSNKISFTTTMADASHLAQLAADRFAKNEFSDLAYAEPLYVKEFYSSPRKN